MCHRQVQILTIAYNGKHYIWVLSLIDFFIWMCHFDSIVSSNVELDNQVLFYDSGVKAYHSLSEKSAHV